MEEDFDLDPIEAQRKEIIKELYNEADELFQSNRYGEDGDPPRAVFHFKEEESIASLARRVIIYFLDNKEEYLDLLELKKPEKLTLPVYCISVDDLNPNMVITSPYGNVAHHVFDQNNKTWLMQNRFLLSGDGNSAKAEHVFDDSDFPDTTDPSNYKKFDISPSEGDSRYVDITGNEIEMISDAFRKIREGEFKAMGVQEDE